VAAALLIAVVVSRPGPQREAVQASRPAVKPGGIAAPTPDPREPVLQDAPRSTSERRGTNAAPRDNHAAVVAARTRRSQPEILIDQREMRALQQLIAGARDGRVDLSAAQNSAPTAAAELEPVADIVIVPLTIEPIAPVPGAEGVRP